MAADVLLYRADEVPVGDDQRQHVELMRDVAERFNSRFGETLVVPEGVYLGGRRADHGPADPEKKMSTTGGTPQGTVYVTRRARRDHQEVQVGRDRLRARDPIRAPTSPGSATCWRSSRSIARHRRSQQLEREFDGAGYGDFKLAVGEAVVDYLAPVRERYNALRGDEAELEAILALGADKARAIAAGTMRRRARGDGRRAGPARRR